MQAWLGAAEYEAPGETFSLYQIGVRVAVKLREKLTIDAAKYVPVSKESGPTSRLRQLARLDVR